jgi:hypothetical protein
MLHIYIVQKGQIFLEIINPGILDSINKALSGLLFNQKRQIETTTDLNIIQNNLRCTIGFKLYQCTTESQKVPQFKIANEDSKKHSFVLVYDEYR